MVPLRTAVAASCASPFKDANGGEAQLATTTAVWESEALKFGAQSSGFPCMYPRRLGARSASTGWDGRGQSRGARQQAQLWLAISNLYRRPPRVAVQVP